MTGIPQPMDCDTSGFDVANRYNAGTHRIDGCANQHPVVAIGDGARRTELTKPDPNSC